MASTATFKSQFLMNPLKQRAVASRSSAYPPIQCPGVYRKKRLTVMAAVGELSSDSTTYLIAGAATVALLGTAFPILFSRKDLYSFHSYDYPVCQSPIRRNGIRVHSPPALLRCPECDGAGFIRKSGATLRANAARKDEAQIVCPRCNGLGKLNQIDK